MSTGAGEYSSKILIFGRSRDALMTNGPIQTKRQILMNDSHFPRKSQGATASPFLANIYAADGYESQGCPARGIYLGEVPRVPNIANLDLASQSRLSLRASRYL